MTKKFSLEELATIDNLFMSHIERLRRERVPESLLAERLNLRNKVMEALEAEGGINQHCPCGGILAFDEKEGYESCQMCGFRQDS